MDIKEEKKAIKNLKAYLMDEWELTEEQKDEFDNLVFRVLAVGKEEAKAQAVPEGFVVVPEDSLKVALSWMNEDIDPWQMGGDSFAELYEHKPILEALIEAQEQKG